VGDVGYLTNGRLYLCDRRSDMVISGGTNIYPAEIEMVLTQCPGVQDCAVFGIPDEDFGESLAAAVELMPGAQLTAQDIKAYLEARLAKYKVPKRVDFHASLPREDSGKIFKRRLRDPFWQATGRKI
jgi:long-chain acyl-CoA synthetase